MLQFNLCRLQDKTWVPAACRLTASLWSGGKRYGKPTVRSQTETLENWSGYVRNLIHLPPFSLIHATSSLSLPLSGNNTLLFSQKILNNPKRGSSPLSLKPQRCTPVSGPWASRPLAGLPSKTHSSPRGGLAACPLSFPSQPRRIRKPLKSEVSPGKCVLLCESFPHTPSVGSPAKYKWRLGLSTTADYSSSSNPWEI